MLIATITQDGLNTTSSTLNIPWQYSGGFTINFVKDSAYNSYTASCVMGVYDSSVLECAKAIVEPGMVVMSNKTITVPNSMMAENGYLIVAITLTSGSESIALKPVIYKISGNINAVSPLPDDDPTWQSIVESYVNTFLSDNVPTYDEIASLYLQKQNPTLPWDSELYGLDEDGTKILMHRLMQLPSDEVVNLLGTSGTKTAIMVADKEDRPVILYGGANELELAVKDDISNAVPVGTIHAFAGDVSSSSNVPDGYLSCRGQAVSRTTYAKLFAVLGTTYGNGNGSTTFNVPDLRGRVIVSQATTGSLFNTRGLTGGSNSATLTVDNLPEHNHKLGDKQHNAYAFNWGTQAYATVWINGTTATAGNATSGNPLYTIQNEWDNTASTGNGESFSIIQPYMVLNYIIKY